MRGGRHGGPAGAGAAPTVGRASVGTCYFGGPGGCGVGGGGKRAVVCRPRGCVLFGISTRGGGPGPVRLHRALGRGGSRDCSPWLFVPTRRARIPGIGGGHSCGVGLALHKSRPCEHPDSHSRRGSAQRSGAERVRRTPTWSWYTAVRVSGASMASLICIVSRQPQAAPAICGTPLQRSGATLPEGKLGACERRKCTVHGSHTAPSGAWDGAMSKTEAATGRTTAPRCHGVPGRQFGAQHGPLSGVRAQTQGAAKSTTGNADLEQDGACAEYLRPGPLPPASGAAARTLTLGSLSTCALFVWL